MKNKIRKKYQKQFNKLIKKINKNIANDNLWFGRFEARQKNASFEKFEDGSGGILKSVIRFYDKSTKYFKDFIIEYAPFLPFVEGDLWDAANTFITEYSGVWEYENPRLKDFPKDFTKEHIMDDIMNEPYNFYTKYIIS